MAKPIDIRKNSNPYFIAELIHNIELTKDNEELQYDIHNIETMFSLLNEMVRDYNTLPCSEQPKNIKSQINKLQSQIKKSAKTLSKSLKLLRKLNPKKGK